MDLVSGGGNDDILSGAVLTESAPSFNPKKQKKLAGACCGICSEAPVRNYNGSIIVSDDDGDGTPAAAAADSQHHLRGDASLRASRKQRRRKEKQRAVPPTFPFSESDAHFKLHQIKAKKAIKTAARQVAAVKSIAYPTAGRSLTDQDNFLLQSPLSPDTALDLPPSNSLGSHLETVARETKIPPYTPVVLEQAVTNHQFIAREDLLHRQHIPYDTTTDYQQIDQNQLHPTHHQYTGTVVQQSISGGGGGGGVMTTQQQQSMSGGVGGGYQQQSIVGGGYQQQIISGDTQQQSTGGVGYDYQNSRIIYSYAPPPAIQDKSYSGSTALPGPMEYREYSSRQDLMDLRMSDTSAAQTSTLAVPEKMTTTSSVPAAAASEAEPPSSPATDSLPPLSRESRQSGESSVHPASAAPMSSSVTHSAVSGEGHTLIPLQDGVAMFAAPVKSQVVVPPGGNKARSERAIDLYAQIEALERQIYNVSRTFVIDFADGQGVSGGISDQLMNLLECEKRKLEEQLRLREPFHRQPVDPANCQAVCERLHQLEQAVYGASREFWISPNLDHKFMQLLAEEEYKLEQALDSANTAAATTTTTTVQQTTTTTDVPGAVNPNASNLATTSSGVVATTPGEVVATTTSNEVVAPTSGGVVASEMVAAGGGLPPSADSTGNLNQSWTTASLQPMGGSEESPASSKYLPRTADYYFNKAQSMTTDALGDGLAPLPDYSTDNEGTSLVRVQQQETTAAVTTYKPTDQQSNGASGALTAPTGSYTATTYISPQEFNQQVQNYQQQSITPNPLQPVQPLPPTQPLPPAQPLPPTQLQQMPQQQQQLTHDLHMIQQQLSQQQMQVGQMIQQQMQQQQMQMQQQQQQSSQQMPPPPQVAPSTQYTPLDLQVTSHYRGKSDQEIEEVAAQPSYVVEQPSGASSMVNVSERWAAAVSAVEAAAAGGNPLALAPQVSDSIPPIMESTSKAVTTSSEDQQQQLQAQLANFNQSRSAAQISITQQQQQPSILQMMDLPISAEAQPTSSYAALGASSGTVTQQTTFNQSRSTAQQMTQPTTYTTQQTAAPTTYVTTTTTTTQQQQTQPTSSFTFGSNSNIQSQSQQPLQHYKSTSNTSSTESAALVVPTQSQSSTTVTYPKPQITYQASSYVSQTAAAGSRQNVTQQEDQVIGQNAESWTTSTAAQPSYTEQQHDTNQSGIQQSYTTQQQGYSQQQQPATQQGYTQQSTTQQVYTQPGSTQQVYTQQTTYEVPAKYSGFEVADSTQVSATSAKETETTSYLIPQPAQSAAYTTTTSGTQSGGLQFVREQQSQISSSVVPSGSQMYQSTSSGMAQSGSAQQMTDSGNVVTTSIVSGGVNTGSSMNNNNVITTQVAPGTTTTTTTTTTSSATVGPTSAAAPPPLQVNKDLSLTEQFGAENIGHDELGEYVIRRVEIPIREIKKHENRKVERKETVVEKQVRVVQEKVNRVEVRDQKVNQVYEPYEQVQWVDVEKVKETHVERVVPQVRERPVIKEIEKTVEVQVPGPVIEVPKYYTVEKTIEIPRYQNERTPVIVAQSFYPIIVEAEDSDEMTVDVECKIVSFVVQYQDVYVPMTVYRPALFESLVTQHKEVPLSAIPSGQYNALVRELNTGLDFAKSADLFQYHSGPRSSQFGSFFETEKGPLYKQSGPGCYNVQMKGDRTAICLLHKNTLQPEQLVEQHSQHLLPSHTSGFLNMHTASMATNFFGSTTTTTTNTSGGVGAIKMATMQPNISAPSTSMSGGGGLHNSGAVALTTTSTTNTSSPVLTSNPVVLTNTNTNTMNQQQHNMISANAATTTMTTMTTTTETTDSDAAFFAATTNTTDKLNSTAVPPQSTDLDMAYYKPFGNF